MGNTRVFRHSFSGGEVSPELEARLDDAKHQQGVSSCLNMIVQPQGNLERRRGTEFVAPCGNLLAGSRLITFDFSADEQLAIEIAAGKFRFHSAGAPVLAATDAFITTKPVTSVDPTAGVMLLFFNLPGHGLTTGDPITFGHNPSGSLPAGLNLFVVYFAINFGSTAIRLAWTREKALAGEFINFGAGGSNIFVHRVYEVGEAVGFPTAGSTPYICTVRSLAGYIPTGFPPAVATFATPSTITTTNHGFFQGSPVQFSASGGAILPANITAGTVYFVLPLTSNTYQIASTYGSTTPIVFSGPSFGSPQVVRQTLWTIPLDGVYEVPNSYAQGDLLGIKHAQSNDVMVLTHPNYPESQLRRLSATHWQFVPITYGATVATPTIAVVSAPTRGAGINITGAGSVGSPTQILFGTAGTDHNLSGGLVVRWTGGGTISDSGGNVFAGDGQLFVVGGVVNPSSFVIRTFDTAGRVFLAGALPYTVNGTVTFRVTSLLAETTHVYVVTAVDQADNETPPSAEVSIANDLEVDGASNTFSWNAVTGAQRYRVYKKRNGLFGFLQQVDHVDGPATFAFTDDNTLPLQLDQTPPKQDEDLGAGDYARCPAFFEQRLLLGGTRSKAQQLYATRTGTDRDMSYHLPLQATDRISREIAANERLTIRHLVPMGDLLVMTSSGEFRVTSESGGAITPEDIRARQQSNIGCSDVTPVIVSNSVLFASAFGGHLYEMGYQDGSGGFVPGDVCLRATHLFDDFSILDLAYARSRVRSAWVISSSGLLLGLSYLPSEQIGAWHRHDTQGAFESVCVVREGGFDSLYLSVRRFVQNQWRHYIERIRLLPRPTSFYDSYFVDSGLTLENLTASPITIVSGLDHLIGLSVMVASEGVVQGPLVVNGSGEITLPQALAPTKKLQVGLPFTGQVKLLPVSFQADPAYGQSRTKNVTHAALKVLDTARFELGPDPDHLSDSGEIRDQQMLTGMVRALAAGRWTDGGQLILQQTDPLPLCVASLVVELTYGGG